MHRSRVARAVVVSALAVAVCGAVGAGVSAAVATAAAQEKKVDRETKVRDDRRRVEAAGKWIWDDLPRAFETAKASGKPVLVVLRCIPCEACAKLDEDVVDREPQVQAVLDRYVCVRVPKANGLDLATFQFDKDQSWAAFMLHADGTMLGRYGTRSHRTESAQDVTLTGFARSLEAALALHARIGGLRDGLAGKRGQAPAIARPEELPGLKGKYVARLDWEGKVVQSCIHCHMVGEAERRVWRDRGGLVPDSVLFPYPHPSVLGLTMDPDSCATVNAVAPGSSAEKDGFRAGDEIVSLAGQPIVSTADIQWVLHNASDPGHVTAVIRRDGKENAAVKLSLAAGFRRAGDISWRVSTWDLRRMVTGGTVLEEAGDAARKAADIPGDAMALVVKHVGQYGDHAVAKKAGVVAGDVVVEVGGRRARMTETALVTDLFETARPGDVVKWVLVRNGERVEAGIRVQ